MENISFDVLFSLIQQNVLIFFEDDFEFEDKKTAIVYSLMRQNKTSQKEMLEELKQVDLHTYEAFKKMIDGFSKIEITKEDIKKIILYDIESAFDIPKVKDKFNSFKGIYNETEIRNLSEDTKEILRYFGIGASNPNIFNEMFNQYIFNEVEWKDFRIFIRFSAKDSRRFQKYLNQMKEKLVVCIIDNQLGENPYAKEIIDIIKEKGKNKDRFVIGAIFSSTTDKGDIDNDVYFELVEKEKPEKLQAAIARSAYSYILKKLEYTYIETMKQAFENAAKNKDMAYYLANMAATEGITNYQVITEWIKLIFDWKLSKNPELYKMIRFTKLINMLEEEDIERSLELKNIDIFEAYDLNVNCFYEPLASGDIFIVNEGDRKEKIYILLGQDCDMMFSPERPVKNGISEMVEAEAVCQREIGKEVEQNRQSIRIANFPRGKDETRTLEVKYTSRKFIDNQILNLCQFNEFGECEIDLGQKLDDEKMIMPDYYAELYVELQRYFNAIKEVKSVSAEAVETILNSNQSPRIIKLHEYGIEGEKIKYPIKRIGRLRSQYTLFLYKMFLEYRGRHPFNTICMSRLQEGSVEIENYSNVKINVTYLLSPERKINKTDSRKLVWIIKSKDINVLLKDLLNEDGEIKNTDEIYLDNMQRTYDKKCDLSNGKTLVLIKRKGKLCLEVIESKKNMLEE